jgi:hypothetical protein
MGVEPTEDLLGPPTDLKSAKSTGTHMLPCGHGKTSILFLV